MTLRARLLSRGSFAALLTLSCGQGPATSGVARPDAAAEATPPAPRSSPTAEVVQGVCDARVPPGTDDYRLVAERMETLALQKSVEARAVLRHCLRAETAPAEARIEAAERLVDLEEDRTVLIEALRVMLRDRSPAVRLWHKSILGLLFKLRAREALPEISEAILITEEEARSMGLADVVDSAVRILVDFDTEESWAGIERAASDSRASVRRPVVQALSALFNRPKARARLLRFLDDPSTDVRSRACTLLLYEPLTRRDRRPDVFKETPCFPTPAGWPRAAAKVREAIAGYDAYAEKHPPPPPPGFKSAPR